MEVLSFTPPIIVVDSSKLCQSPDALSCFSSSAEISVLRRLRATGAKSIRRRMDAMRAGCMTIERATDPLGVVVAWARPLSRAVPPPDERGPLSGGSLTADEAQEAI